MFFQLAGCGPVVEVCRGLVLRLGVRFLGDLSPQLQREMFDEKVEQWVCWRWQVC